MPTGPTAKSQSGSRRKHLETELEEQKQRYDVLTERIKAIDSDLGQALDSEQRLTLRERRKGLVAERQEVVASMEEIESQLAKWEEGAQVADMQSIRRSESEHVARENDDRWILLDALIDFAEKSGTFNPHFHRNEMLAKLGVSEGEFNIMQKRLGDQYCHLVDFHEGDARYVIEISNCLTLRDQLDQLGIRNDLNKR